MSISVNKNAAKIICMTIKVGIPQCALEYQLSQKQPFFPKPPPPLNLQTAQSPPGNSPLCFGGFFATPLPKNWIFQ